ncbi:hypothetical protein D3C76_1214370 [compost metagenome]
MVIQLFDELFGDKSEIVIAEAIKFSKKGDDYTIDVKNSSNEKDALISISLRINVDDPGAKFLLDLKAYLQVNPKVNAVMSI